MPNCVSKADIVLGLWVYGVRLQSVEKFWVYMCKVLGVRLPYQKHRNLKTINACLFTLDFHCIM